MLSFGHGMAAADMSYQRVVGRDPEITLLSVCWQLMAPERRRIVFL